MSTRMSDTLKRSAVAFSSARPALLAAGIVAIAANLRAPLTSVGPLVDDIRNSLRMSNAGAGMITTLPLLTFAVFSLVAPGIGRRFGDRFVLFCSAALLTLGIVARSIPGIGFLFGGTLIVGVAIAMCNVLVPAVIKREFPDRTGLITGVYSVSMNTFGAIASGVSIPIASGLAFGWSTALGVWAALGFAATLLWLPQLKHNRQASPSPIPAPATGGEPVTSSKAALWRSPLAWQVTVFMGMQSLTFYSLVAWMPKIFVFRGMDVAGAGWMLSLMQLFVIPCCFISSVLAGRPGGPWRLVAGGFVATASGLLGLLAGGSGWMALWVVALGVGGGTFFGLAMMFFSLRTDNALEAARLSGMAQSIGYLLAAVGPTFIGFLYDTSGSWTAPILFLFGAALVCGVSGALASRKGKV